jgi:hypothetical protein
MAKAPTASGVSAALRKAGFERSETHATRIKGWHHYTEGYRVRNWGEGEIRVEHETGSRITPDANAVRRRDAKFAEYAEALRAKGWNVQQLPTTIPCLLVTELGEDAATAAGEENGNG